ncbi:hypothetical protein VPNG_05343 [Cytospora leucostoma]|uniref:Uncharacterized protein n=1 Tax=Cytospora leucostoma TaxID=1230097 RepID=A0A423X4F4_9PEZI|nr:hypothetical protein VPNG_05343 [Cytospora leucostoma]
MHDHTTHYLPASKPAPHRVWQDGDIAFLKTCDAFSPKDYNDLIASGYIHEKATCHPVIILKAQSGRAIITPVTAFSSSAENNFLPPWQQFYHRHKSTDDFRAFAGTKRPNNKHAPLRLADSRMQMPKPRASWVYIRHFWTVPVAVLGRFNKAPGLLQVSRESVAELRRDIKQRCDGQLRDALDRLGAAPGATPEALAPAPGHASSARVAATRGPAPEDTRPVTCSHHAPVVAARAQQATVTATVSYSRVVAGTASGGAVGGHCEAKRKGGKPGCVPRA